MDVSARLRHLEEMLEQAKSMPLSSSVIVNKEEFLEALEAARESLPEEIQHARLVVKDREQLLAKARRDSEALVQRGLAEQQRLASREEVVRRAGAEAERIVADAGERAEKIRLEAEEYVDAKLASLEVAIGKLRRELGRAMEAAEGVEEQLAAASKEAQRGREHLRSGSVAGDRLAAPEGEEA